jgi:hypothetical protein
MTKSLTLDRARDESLREPAVLRHLPSEAEYTFVKLILNGVPDALAVRSWHSPIAPRPRTYAGLDRELSKQEADFQKESPHATNELPGEVEALRHGLVMQLLGETEVPERGFPTRRILIRWVDPARLGIPPDLPNLAGPGQVVEIFEMSHKGAVLLKRQVIAAGPPPWGDERISWIEPGFFNRTLMTLIRHYFRPILRRRIGARWRNQRPATGWPVLTRHVIPALYDYFRPLYPVRRYRRGASQRPGHYPSALLRDITDILQFECPHLARQVTPARVQAAIQRYLKHARPDRPMGSSMFAARPT